ncbi:uncharacterized protein MELLADRAFT_102997 [Melampsora larici-populina 98AG31]|uniref:Mediator of RNA polymerase II transcription subunit 9 n=1 Tax=Melampsora larici-populina (strain 98AG31 / pathotype 3-4-7) TaxID=747676 RepID=F4RA80_MELLP|nr:uncharacterized protein MELLADRAFT_102997 [Melampsora larici-populina 98AG31]EGG10825.1 hypothetical protein MELLADRAFT_102997 [Melampsora larici-populina 98AG31]
MTIESNQNQSQTSESEELNQTNYLSSSNPNYKPIDPSLFVNLLSQLGDLIKNVGSSDTNESKLSLANQANGLRTSLAQATEQIDCLIAGDLSIEDQEYLIDQLEKRLETEMSLLKFVNEIPHSLSLITTPGLSSTPQQTLSPDQTFLNSTNSTL